MTFSQAKTSILAVTTGMVSNRTRFKILQAVAAVHVVVVAGPFIWQSIADMINPKPKQIMNVRMIDRLPEEVSDRNEHGIGGGGDAPPLPPDVAPVQRPQQTTPPIPQPTVSQPNVVPFKPPPMVKPMAQKTQPVVKPPPVIVAARPKDTRNTQKPPKTPPAPRQDDKTFTAIDPKQLAANTNPNANPNTNTNTLVGPSGGTGNNPSGRPSDSNRPPGPPGDGIAGPGMQLDYAQYMAYYLKQNWDTPSRIQLGGREPEVTLTMHLSPSGEILSWKIVKSSGITVMDASVEKLMRFIRKLPKPPPKGMTELTLIMTVTD